MLHDHDGSSRPCVLHLPDEAATLALGGLLAGVLTRPAVVYLCGDLGAGKTTLVRGLLRALGYEKSVRSPTYTLVELYAISRLDFYHFDFYRFTSPDEFLDAGLDEYFGGRGVCLVEWPERAAPHLPAADLRITLSVVPDGRRARIDGLSEEGERCLKNLAPRLTEVGRTPP